MNGIEVASLVKIEIINGGNIVKLNRANNIPKIRWITANCIVIVL
jgi:hypothetical protein